MLMQYCYFGFLQMGIEWVHNIEDDNVMKRPSFEYICIKNQKQVYIQKRNSQSSSKSCIVRVISI